MVSEDVSISSSSQEWIFHKQFGASNMWLLLYVDKIWYLQETPNSVQNHTKKSKWMGVADMWQSTHMTIRLNNYGYLYPEFLYKIPIIFYRYVEKIFQKHTGTGDMLPLLIPIRSGIYTWTWNPEFSTDEHKDVSNGSSWR